MAYFVPDLYEALTFDRVTLAMWINIELSHLVAVSALCDILLWHRPPFRQ